MFVDEIGVGANEMHRRALEWAEEQSCRVVILEDDAIPVDGFTNKLAEWINRFPDALVSFYLGTGRPPQYQLDIASKLNGLSPALPPHHHQTVTATLWSLTARSLAVKTRSYGSTTGLSLSVIARQKR